MRALTKILLSACTLCALGPVARAGNQVPGPGPGQAPSSVPPQPLPPSQVPPPPTPSDSPGKPDPNVPDPATPGTPTSPTPIDVSVSPAPPTPVPDTTTTTTETTTTTTTTTTIDEPAEFSYAWYEPTLQSGVGVSAIVGGGVTGFTDKTMRATTSDVGGLWDLRVTIGSHLPLALDVSYLGSATNINGLPTGNKGTLIGTTVEGALRYNILPHFPFTPYVFAGVGWQRYDVTQTTVTLSDSGMNDHDNLLEFPLGTGIAYRMNGFVFDLKGTYRPATDQNLVLKTPTIAPTSSDFATMHTWEASAALGMEF